MEAAILTTKNTSVLSERRTPNGSSQTIPVASNRLRGGVWQLCLSGQSIALGSPTKAHTSLLLLLLLETGSSCLSFLEHHHAGSVNSLNSTVSRRKRTETVTPSTPMCKYTAGWEYGVHTGQHTCEAHAYFNGMEGTPK